MYQDKSGRTRVDRDSFGLAVVVGCDGNRERSSYRSEHGVDKKEGTRDGWVDGSEVGEYRESKKEYDRKRKDKEWELLLRGMFNRLRLKTAGWN